MADAPAQLSLDSARRLDAMYREWQAFKLAQGGQGGSTGIAGIGVNAPLGWIQFNNGSLISGAANRWKYSVDVMPNPFAKLVTPNLTALATTQSAFNTAEIGNTSTSAMGLTIVTSSPQCGDIVGVKPLHQTYKGPVLAQLFWTFFESGNPDTGYWAWWVTLPNFLNVQEPT